MRRRPFLTFILIISALIGSVLSFIQSERFAVLIKKVVASRIPGDLGIEGDFQDFSVKLFPPGISIRKPSVALKPRNILRLPPGSRVTAERMDLIFLPVQMFSGNIRVNNVVIVKGEVQLKLDKNFLAKKKESSTHSPIGLGLSWDELLQVRAEAISLEDTIVDVEIMDLGVRASLLAQDMRLSQWEGRGGLGYELSLDLKDIRGSFPKDWNLPDRIDHLHGVARVNVLGLQMEELKISRDGVAIVASGQAEGDVMNPKSLQSEIELQVRGNLDKIFDILNSSASAASFPSGYVEFNGKVWGNLLRPTDSFRAEGSLLGTAIKYRGWEADQVSAEGGWVASRKGGVVSVKKALISAGERPRVGGNQPGRGGSVEVGEFKVSLGSPTRVSVPVQFRRAHIHWLGGPAVKQVYPIGFRLTGQTALDYVPDPAGKFSRIEAKLDADVDDFILDNQRLGKTKSLKKIFEIPKIKISGPLVVDSRAVRLTDIKVALPASSVLVNGKIDFKTGFDFRGDGLMDLKDLGSIAGNTIRGTGSLSVHVHGPSERVYVDIDTKIQDAYYLRLKLGQLTGRITWDDDPSHLYLTGVQAQQGLTRYSGDGKIDLGDVESIALKVAVPNGGRIQDMMMIFSEFTDEFWWFPASLTGQTEGTIDVSGGLSLDELKIISKQNGSNWDFLGERFKKVTLAGGYDRGKFFVSESKGVKNTGSINGRISYDAHGVFDWDIAAEEMSAGDLDHFARLDVPVRGKISFKSQGKGKELALESETTGKFSEVAIRGIPMPASDLDLRTSGGIARLNSVVLGGQGTLNLNYDFRKGNASSIRAELRALDFSTLLLLLNPRLLQDKELQAQVSGSADLSFKSGEIERGSGAMELAELSLNKTGAKFSLTHPVAFSVDRGNFHLAEIVLRGNRGDAKMQLEGRDGIIQGAVDGELDLSIAEFLTSTVQKASGTTRLDLDIAGKLKAPAVLGKIVLNGASMKLNAVENSFENIVGTIQVKQNLLNVVLLEADLAQGRIDSSGTITLFADRVPKLELVGNLQGNRLKIFPFQFVKVRGKIRAVGEKLPYLVEGNVTVESALSREKILNQVQGRTRKSALYEPSAGNRGVEGSPSLFRLNIGAVAEKGILVQNDLFDAELKGNVTVVNTLDTPRILGNAELIQGRMLFKDRTFQVHSANMNFDNPAVINPKFNLTATTDVSNTKVQIYVAGRLDKYKIELTSTPSLAESEILNLLAMGLTREEANRLRASDSSSFEQGEAASLLLHSLDFTRDVRTKTGFDIQIDEARDTQTGNSIFRPIAETDTTSSPKIVIKRSIGKKVDLSVGSTVGAGANSQRQVNAEVKVTPGFSVLGVWDTIEGVNTMNVPQRRDSYGFDLKLQKRFK